MKYAAIFSKCSCFTSFYLHQGVGDEHHVHPVKDGGQHGMPEADFPLEIQHTHHNFP